jgi:hypothetical protein
MHVAHVCGHCEGIYARAILWLFSRVLILLENLSLNIVEHGMDLNMKG